MRKFAAIMVAVGALALSLVMPAPASAAEARQGIKWWMGSPGAYAYIAPETGWNGPQYGYLGPRHYPPYDAKSPAYGLSGTSLPRSRQLRR